jgi:hypothetical protein
MASLVHDREQGGLHAMPVSLILGFFILLNIALMMITSGSLTVMGVFGALMVTAITFGVLVGAAKLLDEDLEEQTH